jgi:hypothetical protein
MGGFGITVVPLRFTSRFTSAITTSMALTTRSAHRVAPSEDRVGRDPTVSCWIFSILAVGTPVEMLLVTLSRSCSRVGRGDA